MFMLIYTILAMAVTPFLYELLNRKLTAHETIINRVKGWPAWAGNVILCGVMAGVVFVLPAAWEFSLWNWAILAALIYFGNQFVYQTAVKLWLRAKTRV